MHRLGAEKRPKRCRRARREEEEGRSRGKRLQHELAEEGEGKDAPRVTTSGKRKGRRAPGGGRGREGGRRGGHAGGQDRRRPTQRRRRREAKAKRRRRRPRIEPNPNLIFQGVIVLTHPTWRLSPQRLFHLLLSLPTMVNARVFLDVAVDAVPVGRSVTCLALK